MTDKLKAVLKAIDHANAADPKSEEEGGTMRPAALLYGERMGTELARLFPDASEILQIAARGQHIERWKLARSDYPEGRAGYLNWRRAQAANHAARVGDIMRSGGYSTEDCARAKQLLQKQGIKRDVEVQALEDVICFVFLRWYFPGFAAKHTAEKVRGIVTKTARKMSDVGRARALAEFELPEELKIAFAD